MTWARRLRSVWRWVFRRQRLERELEAELQAFIDIAAGEKVREGTPLSEARRLARLELGGLEQARERVRSGRHGGAIDEFSRDLRTGVRILRQSPMFTLTAILTLAVGIGGITAIFSVVYGVILRPLPYGEADRLVTIPERRQNVGRPLAPLPTGVDWPDNNNVLEDITFFQGTSRTLPGIDGPRLVDVLWVTPNYLSVLKAAPLLGRDFTPGDLQNAEGRVALVSYGYWQREFGGTRDILGRELKFSEGTLTVIGVMPRGFRAPGTASSEIWAPIPRERLPGNQRLARMKPGLSLSETEEALNGIIKRIEEEFPASAAERRALVQPVVRESAATNRLLFMLFGSVAFILLIAVINVANLMLSRGVKRGRELAIRAAFGASRLRLIRQLLVESLVLAVIGGAAGLVLAYGFLDLILSQMPQTFPRLNDIYIDSSVLLFVVIATVTGSLAFGILPAFGFSRPDLVRTLKNGAAQASESQRRKYLRQSLVAVEVALAAVLLIGAGLTAKSFWTLLNMPLGFETEDVIGTRLSLSRTRYPTEAARHALYEKLLGRVRRHPEVESASLALINPVEGGMIYANYTVEGMTRNPEPASIVGQPVRVEVSSGYFATLRISFIAGRPFEPDEQAVVINESMALRYMPNLDPIGRRLKFGSEEQDVPWFTIVGVVQDQNNRILDSTLVNLGQIFLPCDMCTNLLVRTRGVSTDIGNKIRTDIREIDDTMIVMSMSSLDETLAHRNTRAEPRFRSTLFAAFAGTALLLALAGVYGVTSYSAAQRTKEIGIRIAIGATRRDVIWLMMKQSMLPMLLGIGAGLAAALALSRLLTAYLYDVSPLDPQVFAFVGIVLTAVALLANFIPIFRSASENPMASLRCD